MKEIMRRFRCWLIRKLGGFDVQYAPVFRTTHVRLKGHPRRVVATARSSLGFVVPNTAMGRTMICEEFERVKRDLSRQIADHIFRSMAADAVLFDCKDDVLSMQREYRATVFLLPASEGIWMERHIDDDLL